MAATEREKAEQLLHKLWLERSTFDAAWKQTAQFTKPRRTRFFADDVNRGNPRNQFIINPHATKVINIAQAGMLSGVMSPAKAWFALGVPDTDLMANHAVQVFLSDLSELLRNVFNRSNLYTMAPLMLTENYLFGTGCIQHVKDFNTVARFYAHTTGSYALAQDDTYTTNTLARKFQMTAPQMAKKWGLGNLSPTIRNAYDTGEYTQRFTIHHVVQPNPNTDPTKLDSSALPFSSDYFDPGDPQKDRFLERTGFARFPFYTPRWEVTGEDVYATSCPGVDMLPMIKALQILERRKAQAIDKMVNPPLQGPASLATIPLRDTPGGGTFYDDGAGNSKITSLYQVNLPIGEVRQEITAIEQKINELGYRDLFDSINSMEGVQPQNQLYLNLKNDEKLLQLGPVLQQFNTDFLDRLISNTIDDCFDAGIAPPPPPQMQGQRLNVRYISPLALAQRAAMTGNLERLTYFVGGLKAVSPNVGDKIDGDAMVDEYASDLGVSPKVMASDEDVAGIRQQRQQQAQQATSMQQAQAGAGTVKTLSEADTQNPSALTAMVQQLGGGGVMPK